ncbi:5-formyltetrahydrofolate cyclo-ligase [Sulfurovum sp. zt1-1]|uniref:5-formyltetrahydrofolate cyclo-ligase n=1 Tax=Sulfurovum zhangzhouensis TaxID=3019067 RepID=A0ABT7QYX8_9BACT|nr:5-formyltetrahydrofolate cyclo-ligase [Sulfurovum zhangzhouensis]MDM5272044.1 5-formyltetrahydrofolate cyclo-ligase [Sulfurovum zhangzhouensis]
MRQTIEKRAFRASCLEKLRKASQRGAYSKDKSIVQRLYSEIVAFDAQNIMLYLPLGTEVNLYPLIKQLRKEGRKLYVPFMEGKSFRLVKYRLPLEKKKFGIKEPKDSKQYRQKAIDMAIVPIVGLDVTQRRVGFGKGMYDRFFEKENKNIKRTVFLARELCYSKEIITDDFDVTADMIITG